MRYAMLLQKQNRPSEAIEQFSAAAGCFSSNSAIVEALACYESMALLDPENPARHIVLGEFAAKLGHVDLATRSYVRAGQLILAARRAGRGSRIFWPRPRTFPGRPELCVAVRGSSTPQGRHGRRRTAAQSLFAECQGHHISGSLWRGAPAHQAARPGARRIRSLLQGKTRRLRETV